VKLRNKILIPVILILLIAVSSITAINYFIARQTVTELIDTEMDAAISNILAAEQLSNEITNIVINELNIKNISLVKALAEIIRINPNVLETDEMIRLAEMLNVTEVHVADEDGILQHGNVSEYFGFDFASGDQSRPFLEILDDPGLEIAQDAQPNVAIGAMFSYIGVARTDKPGIVQVGISAEILDNLISSFDIQRTVERSKLGKNGFMFIVKDDIITAHFDANMIGNSFTPSLQRNVGENREWLTLGGVEYYAGFYSTGEFTAYAVVTRNEFFSQINMMSTMSVAVSAIAIALMLVILLVLSWRITLPIKSLLTASKEIARGNLDYSINIQTGDEIEELGLSVNKMAADLKDYIADLQSITAEKERIGAELDVATKIQTSMLPCIFPAFPHRNEFDIYASMKPAKEVGGDFYDFFMIDDHTLGIVMADVSGKGIPAALFMVITKTLIKNTAQTVSIGGSGKNPKEVLEIVNNLLHENNDADMFVTVFLGYFDIPGGKLTYVNAGHNPPLIKRAGENFDWLKTKQGFILGGVEDITYKQYEVVLQSGDDLLLYTDGITEAANNEEELFSEQRLLESANNAKDLPLKDLTESIKQDIDNFTEGAQQTDDITMLILRLL